MQRSKRTLRLLGLILSFGLCAVGCGLCADKDEAVLEQVTPEVTVSHEGFADVAAEQGTKARSGDTISTDGQGAAELLFANGSKVRLGSSSSVYLEGGEAGLQARRVRLLFGTIDAEGAAENLLVMTSLGPIAFSDAKSKVTITSGDDGVTVHTVLGEVSMGDQTVGAGVTIRLDSGGIVFEKEVDAGASEDAGAESLGTTGPITISLSSGKNVVRQRGGKGRFVRVKIGEPLMATDLVEARGKAKLSLGDIGEASLGRRARVAVGGEAVAGRRPLFEAARGTTKVVLTKGARQAVGLGATIAEISAGAHSADVELTRDRSSSRVRVFAGKVTLFDASGKQVRVGANQKATINSKGEALVRESETGPLRIVAGLRRILVAGPLPAVSFDWKALPDGGPYTIEIAKDPEFSELVTVAQVEGTSYTTDRIGYGSFHWRVRNASKQNPARTVSFGRDRSSASTDARRNVVRASGERTVILYQQFKTPQLTFKWAEREDAKQYRISVYADGKFETPVAERVVQAPEMKLAAGMLKDGRYLWAVSSLSEQGKVVSTSDMYDLEVKYDSNQMLLRVMAPPVGARVAGKSVETRGMVPPGAKLIVNGTDVHPDKEGRFTAMVSVPRNAPYLIYKLGSVLFVRPMRR